MFDEGIRKLGEKIKQKQESSNRYRTSNTRYTSSNNKFVTKATSEYNFNDHIENKESYDSSPELAIYQSEIYGNNQLLLQKQKKQQTTRHIIGDDPSLCFMDYLYTAINASKSDLSESMIERFTKFLRDNEYETDTICDDISGDNGESNIINNTKNYEKENIILTSILNKFVYINTSHSTLYNAGYRYFYWDYYKHIDKEWHTLWTQDNGQAVVEGNSGYMIKDWFIPRKYKNLREELLINAIFTFSIQQFNEVRDEASIKLKHWLDNPDARPLQSQLYHIAGTAWAERCYNIPQGTQISVQHIIALLCYTNYTNHCSAFSSTFRRMHGFETDQSLKARNREFWHWSRLLRELVECFGQEFGEIYQDTPTLWHGVSAQLIFDSTFIKLCGPFSTTAGLYALFFKRFRVFTFFIYFCLSFHSKYKFVRFNNLYYTQI